MTSAPEWLTITSFYQRLTAAGFELNREWLGLIIKKAGGPITKPGRLWQGAPTRLVLWPHARNWYLAYTAKPHYTNPARPKNVDIDAIRKSLGLAPSVAAASKALIAAVEYNGNITLSPAAPLPPPKKRGRPRKGTTPEIRDKVQVPIPAPRGPSPAMVALAARGTLEILEFGGLQMCRLGPITQYWSLGSAGERTLIWPL